MRSTGGSKVSSSGRGVGGGGAVNGSTGRAELTTRGQSKGLGFIF